MTALRLGCLAAIAVAAGCDQNCQNTCARIYSTSECGITIAGVDANTSRVNCVEACQTALTKSGEMGDYNPYNHPNPSDPPELENERQAAAWMECVWSRETCDDLDPATGVCAPIVF